MIKIDKGTGFVNTDKFLKAAEHINIDNLLNMYGQKGVVELQKATPVDTGTTAKSWRYEIEREKGKTTISWCNDNVNKGVNIAIILQYGHGTRNGGYVQGIDYINPALQATFNNLMVDIWRAVTSL